MTDQDRRILTARLNLLQRTVQQRFEAPIEDHAKRKAVLEQELVGCRLALADVANEDVVSLADYRKAAGNLIAMSLALGDHNSKTPTWTKETRATYMNYKAEIKSLQARLQQDTEPECQVIAFAKAR